MSNRLQSRRANSYRLNNANTRATSNTDRLDNTNGDDNDEQEEVDTAQDDSETTITYNNRPRRDYSSVVTMQDTNNASTTNTTASIPTSYIFFWQQPDIVGILRWIAFLSIFLLVIDASVFLMWLLRLIPSIPPTFLYYGFIWYILFIFTAVVTLCVSFLQNKSMFLITSIVLSFALLVILFLVFVIARQIIDCYNGLLGSSCTNLYFTQIVLLGLSLVIAFIILVLFILFWIMVIRIRQVWSVRSPYATYY